MVAAVFEEMGDLDRQKRYSMNLARSHCNLHGHSSCKPLRIGRQKLLNCRHSRSRERSPRGLGPISSDDSAELGFLLSRAYDKLGQYDSAWTAAADAHTAKPEVFDVDQYESEAERIMDFFTRSRIKKPTGLLIIQWSLCW